MRSNTILLSMLFCLLSCKSDYTEHLYFGQEPPGLEPELFAPGIVSVDRRFEGAVSFSPDLKEIYFSADHDKTSVAVFYSKLKKGKWSPVKRADFTNGAKKEEMHPFVSPDGKRIYFTAMDSSFADEKIWYVNRQKDGWSDAQMLDAPINEDLVFFPNQAKNGDLYYFNLSKFKSCYAPNKEGKFSETYELPIRGHHAFIAPSQDYLIYTDRNNRDDERKDNDMFVCFKESDGTWSEPINLGESLNTNLNEKGPRISPDEKYLFFGRDEGDIKPGLANIYWVKTEAITRLRSEQKQ